MEIFQSVHIFGSEMEIAKQCQLNHKMVFTIRYEGLWLGTQVTGLRSVRLCILKLGVFWHYYKHCKSEITISQLINK